MLLEEVNPSRRREHVPELQRPEEPRRRYRREEDHPSWSDPGDQMPYVWPRGPTVGSKRGLHVAQALAILALGTLIAALVYMILNNP